MSVLGKEDEFGLALSSEQLANIIENKTTSFALNPINAYNRLSEANQRTLKHLVRAAKAIDLIFLQQDHLDNLRARDHLTNLALEGDADAVHALALFKIQNGVEGTDHYAPQTTPLRIFKHKELAAGFALFPADVTKEELVAYLIEHPEQASAILGNNTCVRREGPHFVAEPYSVVFRTHMQDAARELLLAAKETDHLKFAHYLRLQAQALVNDSDPDIVFNTDKTWIGLEDAPLEFTIARESYLDRLTSQVASDPRLAAVLTAHGIVTKPKDFLGARVGIVNTESYAVIDIYRRHIKDFKDVMPLRELYPAVASGVCEPKFSFADVDLVAMCGQYAAIRTGITTASTLPNDDKLVSQMQLGRRIVFHRQVRQQSQAEKRRAQWPLIDPEQIHWLDPEAAFQFVIGHELGHSCGPISPLDGRDSGIALGKWSAMLEENKADLVSVLFTQYLVEKNAYSAEQANKIYLSWIFRLLPTKQPSENEAHLSRAIMQLNYFRERGALTLEKDVLIRISPEKIPLVAHQMLSEVVTLQLEGKPEDAQIFVAKYVAWNEALQSVVDQTMQALPRLFRDMRQPMRSRLLHSNPAQG